MPKVLQGNHIKAQRWAIHFYPIWQREPTWFRFRNLHYTFPRSWCYLIRLKRALLLLLLTLYVSASAPSNENSCREPGRRTITVEQRSSTYRLYIASVTRQLLTERFLLFQYKIHYRNFICIWSRGGRGVNYSQCRFSSNQWRSHEGSRMGVVSRPLGCNKPTLYCCFAPIVLHICFLLSVVILRMTPIDAQLKGMTFNYYTCLRVVQNWLLFVYCIEVLCRLVLLRQKARDFGDSVIS